jgi:hypothetical protein
MCVNLCNGSATDEVALVQPAAPATRLRGQHRSRYSDQPPPSTVAATVAGTETTDQQSNAAACCTSAVTSSSNSSYTSLTESPFDCAEPEAVQPLRAQPVHYLCALTAAAGISTTTATAKVRS